MSIISVNRFSHISNRVSNIEASLSFYQDTLGLQLIFDISLPGGIGRAIGCQTPDNCTVELVQLNDGEGKPQTVDASADTGMLAFSVEDIQAAHSALINAGVAAPEPFEIEGVKMMFIQDPDGRNIEIAQFPGNANTAGELHGQ